MKKLILHPTDLSQWHALVNEAEVITNLALHEDTESYLVFLLMRFTNATKLSESVLALDFLKSKNTKHIGLMRDVGDKSLLFSGLFPGMAQKRRVSLDYFTDIGKTAYLTVSELQDNQSSQLYRELSQQFINLQQVLQAMRISASKIIKMCDMSWIQSPDILQ